jgi:hypothetical protein
MAYKEEYLIDIDNIAHFTQLRNTTPRMKTTPPL